MDSLGKARATQLANIEQKTGKKLDELRSIIHASGLQKHGQIRQMMIDKFELGFGDATMLVHFALESDGQTAAEATQASMEEILAGIYSGSKAGVRLLHDKAMSAINNFGEFSIAPKKGYLSLRQKRQFAMIGPGTKGRLEIGLNIKDLPSNGRLLKQPAGGMCQYKVFVSKVEEVDEELIQYIKTAYDSSN